MTLFELRNPVQRYDWGSRTAIPELTGRAPADEPEAELWMGAHPKAPSQVRIDGEWTTLDRAIRRDPEGLLGVDVARDFENRLPFLFKILAAERPLSIQAHPDRHQAIEGFRREEAAGIDRWAERRNYRDRHHKPEILYALTDFTILRGFREPAEAAVLFARAGAGARLESLDSTRALLDAFLSVENGAPLLAGLRAFDADDPEPAIAWARRLADVFPGDRGALAPLFLQVVTLEPGEAVYTAPGTLHAYLGGVGVELMASSDNVLRGGCTSKHVDRDELARVVTCEPARDGRVVPRAEDGALVFDTPAEEFRLSVVHVERERPHRRGPGRREASSNGIEILLVTEGEGEIVHRDGGGEARRAFGRGDSFLIPGGAVSATDYRVEGEATLFRAEVP